MLLVIGTVLPTILELCNLDLQQPIERNWGILLLM